MDPNKALFLILLAPGAILAIALHEAMHGYVADKLGDNTARLAGRLTLNPFAHIDLFGTILVPALLYLTAGMMFGWARPVPVKLAHLHNPKRDMALVAAAGPGANLALATIASVCLYAMAALIPALPVGEAIGRTVVFPLAMILIFMLKFNLFLMMFNLLPLPPLDGGRILVGVLPYRQARAVASIEPFGFLILVLILIANRAVPFLSVFFTPVRWLEAVMLPSGLARLVGG